MLRAIDKITRANNVLGTEIRRAYFHIMKNKESNIKMRIQPPTDTIEPYIEKGCEVIGIGRYFDGREGVNYNEDPLELLNYDEEVVSRKEMSKTQVAGFWAHESMYYVFRNFSGHQNSNVSRVLNVMAFSDGPMPVLSAKPKGAELSYRCETENVTDNKSVYAKLYLHKVKGEYFTVPETITTRIANDFKHTVKTNFVGGLFMFERTPLKYSESTPQQNTYNTLLTIGVQTDYEGARISMALNSFENNGADSFEIKEWGSILLGRGWDHVFYLTSGQSLPYDILPKIICKKY